MSHVFKTDLEASYDYGYNLFDDLFPSKFAEGL